MAIRTNNVEVDERGYLPGRGGEFGSYAFSYTGHGEDRISRGNPNKLDDIMVRPGQTWCVVSSPVEGDTPETTRTVPGGKGAAKKGEEALVGAKDELDLGDDDLFDIEIRKESETAELTRPAGK